MSTLVVFMMKNQKYGRSSSVRVKMVKSDENFMMNSRQSGRPAYEDKSLDMREGLNYGELR